MTKLKIPHSTDDRIDAWFNFHHTIAGRPVEHFLTLDALPSTETSAAATFARQAEALNAALEHCFKANPPERATILGSRWSLSDVLDPDRVIIDPGTFNRLLVVDEKHLTAAYKTRCASTKGRPVIAQGGIQIGVMNEALGKAGLTLPTSGAADGHRLAGCIATGTHGAAYKFGAVHDAVLAMHMVVAPNQAVLVQPKNAWFGDSLAEWFAAQTTIPTKPLADDDVFRACLVALGSLGFVHSVVLEAVPLYELVGTTTPCTLDDPRVWNFVRTLDTSIFSPKADPFNAAMMIMPYAQSSDAAVYVNLLWKQAPSRPFSNPAAVGKMMPSDTSRIVSSFIGAVDESWSRGLIEKVITGLMAQQFSGPPPPAVFPSQMFGPTSLPEGNGRSTEIAVAHGDAERALKIVVGALKAEGAAGRHLLGALGVRFVGQSDALLAMNIHAPTMFMELAGIASSRVAAVHQAAWAALRDAGVKFTCHWGQEYGDAMSEATLKAYFGDRVERWKAARMKLLPDGPARTVFASKLALKMKLA